MEGELHFDFFRRPVCQGNERSKGERGKKTEKSFIFQGVDGGEGGSRPRFCLEWQKRRKKESEKGRERKKSGNSWLGEEVTIGFMEDGRRKEEKEKEEDFLGMYDGSPSPPPPLVSSSSSSLRSPPPPPPSPKGCNNLVICALGSSGVGDFFPLLENFREID